MERKESKMLAAHVSDGKGSGRARVSGKKNGQVVVTAKRRAPEVNDIMPEDAKGGGKKLVVPKGAVASGNNGRNADLENAYQRSESPFASKEITIPALVQKRMPVVTKRKIETTTRSWHFTEPSVGKVPMTICDAPQTKKRRLAEPATATSTAVVTSRKRDWSTLTTTASKEHAKGETSKTKRLAKQQAAMLEMKTEANMKRRQTLPSSTVVSKIKVAKEQKEGKMLAKKKAAIKGRKPVEAKTKAPAKIVKKEANQKIGASKRKRVSTTGAKKSTTRKDQKREEKKKRKRNRRSQRKKPAALTADDFTREEKGGDRRRWGSYLQMDVAKKVAPYVGKTPDVVRRTKEHRKGLCKQTRRFKGDISPVWFVDNGFGCDRDVQQYEWRMKHEYSPKTKFRRSFGGAEARKLRDQETARIRVPSQTKPSANLNKALHTFCSMLQVAHWTTSAIPIGHEWRAALPEFVVHWFGPDPICYGYDIKRLTTAYPVRHIFNCTLDEFIGSADSNE
jgi:predicted GIY-YIG superfamily endonuclease